MLLHLDIWTWSAIEISENLFVNLLTKDWNRSFCAANQLVETKPIYSIYLCSNDVFLQPIVLFYPRRSSWVSKVVISLRAPLGRQKLLISSSRRARAPLSTIAKLPWSKKGSRGPRASRARPSICPSAWEEPCRAADISRWPGIKGISHPFNVLWQSVEDTADMNHISIWNSFILLVLRFYSTGMKNINSSAQNTIKSYTNQFGYDFLC